MTERENLMKTLGELKAEIHEEANFEKLRQIKIEICENQISALEEMPQSDEVKKLLAKAKLMRFWLMQS